MSYEKDITGQVFGRLTVLKKVDTRVSPSGKRVDTRWLCRCSCAEHNEVIVTRARLVSGGTKSCGCIRREVTAQKNRDSSQTNEYDLSGEYGIGKTKKGEVFLFDLEDYEKIKDLCWHFDRNGYLSSNTYLNGRRTSVKMHRLIMNAGTGEVVDHIIHSADPKANKTDNRKSNLRFVTKAQNAQNQVPIRSTNTSGHKGVSWNPKGYWAARITANGRLYQKCFKEDQYEEACKWYDEMAEKLHGNYRFTTEEERRQSCNESVPQ